MIREILQYPHEALRKPAKFVELPDRSPELDDAMMDVLHTLHSMGERAMALAANQIGLDMSFFALRGGTLAGISPQFIFNPRIIRSSKWLDKKREGCLSFMDQYFEIERHRKIEVEFQSYGGAVEKLNLSGFHARVFQHEIDHLNGIVFTDHIK